MCATVALDNRIAVVTNHFEKLGRVYRLVLR